MPSPDLCTEEEAQHLVRAFHANMHRPGPLGPIDEAPLSRKAGPLPQVP